MSKKNCIINCAACDTTKIKEEEFLGYEHIMINAGVVVVNARSRGVLNRLGAQVNSGSIINIPEDVSVNIKTVNGNYELTPEASLPEHCVLLVNGSLAIRPGSDEILSSLEHIIVNGELRCPDSLSARITKVTVNGKTTIYPDGAIILDPTFNIDRYFALRAVEGGLYWADGCIMMKDDELNVEMMLNKKLQFSTKQLIINERYVEQAAPMFNPDARIEVIPEGYMAFTDDVLITDQLLIKADGKMIIFADAAFDREFTGWDQIEKLIVRGDLAVHADQKEKLALANVEYDDLDIISNARQITEVLRAKIDRFLLENSPNGIEVSEAAMVVIDADVEPAMILEKLKIRECALVKCSDEQLSAVLAVSSEVAKIRKNNDDDDTDDADPLKLMKQLVTSKIVNAADYVM